MDIGRTLGLVVACCGACWACGGGDSEADGAVRGDAGGNDTDEVPSDDTDEAKDGPSPSPTQEAGAPEPSVAQCETGSLVWGAGEATGLAVGRGGRVLLVGEELRGGANTDLVVELLSEEGEREWREVVNGPANETDRGWAAAVGADLFFAGGSVNGVGGWLRAYDAAGEEAWTATAEPTRVVALAATSSAVYGVGSRELFAFDLDGAELWRVELDADLQANGVTADGDRVYLAAHSTVSGSPFVGIVQAFDAATGDSSWQFDVPGSSESRAEDVATDGEGGVWAVGYEDIGNGRGAWVRRFDDDGDELVHVTHSAGGANDVGKGLAVYGDGSVVFGGVGPSNSRGWLVRIDADGDELWSLPVQAIDDESTAVDNVRLDTDGFLYVSSATAPLKKLCP